MKAAVLALKCGCRGEPVGFKSVSANPPSGRETPWSR